MLDVDGVLVDGRPQDGQRWNFSLEKDLGIAPDVLADGFFSKHWADVIVGKRDLMDALSECLQNTSLATTPEDLINYWFEMDARIVPSVLADCKVAREQGIPVYLTTNQEHKRASYLMKNMGLNSVVDGIVYSAQLGAQKPQDKFYVNASNAVGYDSSDLLLVDDTPANIEGAIKAGWAAVYWDGSERLAEILRRSIT